MLQDIVATVFTLIAAIVWLRINDFAAHRGWIEGRLSRKIIHIGTGPIFVLCWLLFSEQPAARWLAALVPLAITAQFALVGLGIIHDQAAVDAMSRLGDRREILRGPLYYGIVFVALTLVYWLETPIGITALMLLCGGDGLADIIGRRLGKRKLPWNQAKSWAGSLGFFAGGWLLALAVLAIYFWAGIYTGGLASVLLPVTLITAFVTLVESISPHDTDNITIALAAVLLGHIVF